MLRKSLLFIVASIGLFPLASAQYVPLTGSHIQDLSGAPLPSGQICFEPTNNAGTLIPFRAGSGGQSLPMKKCAPVVQGTFSISLADSTFTDPQNVCYRTSVVVPTVFRPTSYEIASCLQPSETITSANSAWCTTSGCNLDDYPPNLAPLVVVQSGTPGPPGPAGTDGITQLTGDVTATGPGSAASTLATVNSSPGTCGDATHVCQVTTNAKGLTTTQTPVPITTGGGGTVNAGTANQLAYYAADGAAVGGTNALPNGTTATTQAAGDTTAKVATDAFVLANAGGGGSSTPVSGATAEYPMTDGAGTTVTDVSGNGNNATFCTTTHAPAWYTYGVAFNDTGSTSTYTYQCINTPLTTFGTAYFAYCTPAIMQTTGIATGGIPAALYPTLWGGSSTTLTGALLLGNLVTPTQGVNSFEPGIWQNSGSTSATTSALTGFYGNCHVYGFSASTTSDILTVDGQQPANYTTHGASSTFVTLSTGTYLIGDGNSNDRNSLRGVVAYAVIYPTAHTLAQMQQESLYIQNKLSQRPTFPAYPIPDNSRTPQLVFVGDSLTAGFEGSSAWTGTLSLNGTYNITNYGLGGMSAVDMCTTAEQRWENAVVPGQSIVYLWGGTNDAQYGFIPSQAWMSLASCVKKAHALGARVIVMTMLSRNGGGTVNAPGYTSYDQYKDALNPLIRNGWQQAGFDGMVDLAEVAALGADGANTNTACFQANVHLTGPGTGTCATIGTTALSGYGIVAALVSNSVNSLTGSSASDPDVTASNAYVEAAANNYIIQTPTAAATHTLADCQGYVTPRTIVNGSASFSITVQAVNSQAITGSTTVASNATATFLPVLTGNTTGGCSWVRTQ